MCGPWATFGHWRTYPSQLLVTYIVEFLRFHHRDCRDTVEWFLLLKIVNPFCLWIAGGFYSCAMWFIYMGCFCLLCWACDYLTYLCALWSYCCTISWCAPPVIYVCCSGVLCPIIHLQRVLLWRGDWTISFPFCCCVSVKTKNVREWLVCKIDVFKSTIL